MTRRPWHCSLCEPGGGHGENMVPSRVGVFISEKNLIVRTLQEAPRDLPGENIETNM